MKPFNCPRCNKETDCLTGASNGYYDKITKRFYGSSSIITNIDNGVCQKCFDEIRMQDKDYARKHLEFLNRQRDERIISALHNFRSGKGNWKKTLH